jgi:ATP-binding cassette subfamily B multidrug efflux pump
MSEEPTTLPRPNAREGSFASLLEVLAHARSQRRRLIVATLLLAISGLLAVLSAYALGQLVEKGLVAKNLSRAWAFGGLVLGVELLTVAVSYGGRRLMASSSNRALYEIRAKLFAHLNSLPMGYFDREPLGKTVTRVTHDVEGLEEFFGGTAARLLTASLTVSIVLLGMCATNLHLGLLVLVAMLPAVAVTTLFRRPLQQWNRELARRNSGINARLSESLNGIPVIRMFGAEAWSAREFDRTVESHLEAAVRVNVLNSWARPIVQLLCAVPGVALLWFGGIAVAEGTLTLGVFVTFIRYAARFSQPISTIAQEIHTIQAAFVSAERVSRFLREPPESVTLGADGALVPVSGLRGKIEFIDVHMHYDNDAPALDGVSFRIEAGQQIGLAGRTGSGKTSTVALLARLYDFQAGEILIDDVPIRKYQRDALRSHIGFVTQDVTLFKGTLEENLAFGSAADPERILACCARTGLARIMDGRELSLSSEVLDHGANLSAGEKQLVALTRVLIRNPSVLVLDEATANVDPQLEELIQTAILSVMEGRTCLTIAHRLSTLEACDRILVFREGRILESGSHAELLARPGYYADLVRESGGTERTTRAQ